VGSFISHSSNLEISQSPERTTSDWYCRIINSCCVKICTFEYIRHTAIERSGLFNRVLNKLWVYLKPLIRNRWTSVVKNLRGKNLNYLNNISSWSYTKVTEVIYFQFESVNLYWPSSNLFFIISEELLSFLSFSTLTCSNLIEKPATYCLQKYIQVGRIFDYQAWFQWKQCN